MAPGAQARIEGVERALTHHQEDGNIRNWTRIPGVSNRWRVTLHNGVDLDLKTVSEAHAFACGLASAEQAMRSANTWVGHQVARQLQRIAGDVRRGRGITNALGALDALATSLATR